MRTGLGLAILLLWSAAAPAAEEDAREKEVREQLERELNREVDAMVKAPSSMELLFDGLASPRYVLQEGSVLLDGTPLPFKVDAAGSQPLFSGALPPGPHAVVVQLVYREKASSIFTYANLKYRLPGRYSFEARAGLHLRLRLKVEANEGAEPAKRLQLQAALEADMLVDAGAPAAPAAPAAAQAVPDAGVPPAEAARVASASAPDVPVPPQAPVAAAASPDAQRKKHLRWRMKNLLRNMAKSAGDDSDDAEAHLRLLRQNLARQAKEDAAAALPPGEWVEESAPVEDASPAPAATPAPVASPRAPSPPDGVDKPRPPKKPGKGSRSKATVAGDG